MLRKISSLLAAIGLAFVALNLAAPAQAAGTYSPVVTIPQGMYNGNLIPLDDTKSIAIWPVTVDGSTSIKTGLLNSDGTFTNESTLMPSISGARVTVSNSHLTTADGVTAVVWTVTTTSQSGNNTSYNSDIFLAFTEDGIDWSAPVQALPTKSVVGGFDCMMFGDCGYSLPKIAVDRRGVLALAVSVKFGSTKALLVSTSLDGVNWSSATQLEPESGFYTNRSALSAMSTGGFIVAWEFSNADGDLIKYSTLGGGTLNVWQKAKSLGDAGGINDEFMIHQTDATHMSLFYTTGQNMLVTVNQRIYNIANKTWSANAVILTAGQQGWLGARFNQFSVGKDWHSALAIGVVRNGEQHAYAYLLEFHGSTPGLPMLLKTVDQQSMGIYGLKVNYDDSITVLASGLNRPLNIMQVKNGTLVSDENVPNTPAQQIWALDAAVSPNGNIAIATTTNSGVYEGITYLAATKPVPTGTLKANGAAKVGKLLTATLPQFGGVSQIGTTTIQWYTCATAVTTLQTSVPAGCTPITGATAAKFKVTAKQKKKYLAVAVTNANAVGQTTVFSTTTAKAK